MIYVICGPTGSGKTKASLAVAEFLHAPIINADAFQIYQGMDIGTAKLEKSHPYYSMHYLFDIVTPEHTFSVKEYQDIFRKTINELSQKYADIVVCGGTGLYIRASLYDYNFTEQPEDNTEDLEKLDDQSLWELLSTLDMKAAQEIHPHNRKRIIRAISIARTSEMNKSSGIALQKHQIIYPDVSILFINPPREILYENINHRVDEMFNKGLIDEVKNLINTYQLSLTAKQAIGYQEVIAYLNKECSLQDCQEKIKQRTRNYAKRQVTFFKHQFETKEFSSADKLISEVCHHE